MPKGNSTTAEETKPKRKVLTGAEKIAAMEAELAAAREKVKAKASAKLAAADEAVANLEKRKADIEAKLSAAVAERDALREQAGVPVDDQLPVEA